DSPVRTPIFPVKKPGRDEWRFVQDLKAVNAAVQARMRAIRQAVLQNRMALDLLLSHEGGVCQVLKTSCCFSIPDYYENITDLRFPPKPNSWSGHP
uniref:Uncharacterized protein n=1 Tax=Astyanax mexicanus TaxID=7994 RepID=A0A3B1K8M2_ASTMX